MKSTERRAQENPDVGRGTSEFQKHHLDRLTSVKDLMFAEARLWQQVVKLYRQQVAAGFLR